MERQIRRSDAIASRLRILEAARDLFAEHGSLDVTMGDVAVRAGVSRATVFNHFGSKHALVEGVTEEVFAGYGSILDRALEDRATPTPVLIRSLFDIMARGIGQNRGFYRTVFREIARVNLGLEEGGVAQRSRERAIERLVHLLTRGQARGELVTSFDANHLAVAFDSLVFGTLTHWLYTDESTPLEEPMRVAAEIFLGRVEAEAAAEPWDGPDPTLWREGDPGFRDPKEGDT